MGRGGIAGRSAILAAGMAAVLLSGAAFSQDVVPVCEEYSGKSGFWQATGTARKLLDDERYRISIASEILWDFPGGLKADSLYVPFMQFHRFYPDADWEVFIELPFILTLADGREVNFDPDCSLGEIEVDGTCIAPRLGLVAETLMKGTSQATRLRPLEMDQGFEVDTGGIFLADSSAEEWLAAFSRADAFRIAFADIDGTVLGSGPGTILVWEGALEGFGDALDQATRVGDEQWGRLQGKECRVGDD